MAENEEYVTIPTDKVYRIPQELAQKMPVFHADHINTGVTQDQVVLVFCTKLDLPTHDPESDALIPHASFYLSHRQAEKLAYKILADTAHMRDSLDALSEEGTEDVKALEANVG